MTVRKLAKSLHFNRIINTMIWSDFVIMSAAGVFAPILAVYVTGQIRGGDLAAVGFATALYWVMRSVIQVPVGLALDRRSDERLSFKIMVIGYAMMTLTPLCYYFWASEVWHIYLLQSLEGAAAALTMPTWLSLFTHHLDKGKEATEWAAYSNATGLGYAVAAAVGGRAAELYGFRIIFPATSFVMFIGLVILVVAWPNYGQQRRLGEGNHRAAPEA